MEKNNDIKGTCPICENQYHPNDSVCSFCGYGFKNGLVDDDKSKNYMALLKNSRDWAKEIIIKYNFNEFKIKKHGFSSTNPERGGWSITKTGDFFLKPKEQQPLILIWLKQSLLTQIYYHAEIKLKQKSVP